MITPTPEDFPNVQVDRRVRDGEGFLSKVRKLGEQALGTKPVSSLPDVRIEQIGDQEPSVYHVEVPTREPVLNVEEKNHFVMQLMNRSAPPEIASKYSFGYLQNKLTGPVTRHKSDFDEFGIRVSNRYKTNEESLTDECDAIARKHNVNPEYQRVVCDRIDVVGEPGRDIVLGLSPRVSDASSRVLHEQSVAAQHRLNQISKRTANPISPWLVTAPFARVPGDVTDAQYEYLLERINELLPVQITLGGVNYTSKDRGR